MTSQEGFADLVRRISRRLKEEGYSKVGRSTWRTKHGPNYTIINLQNSRWNSEDDSRFAINLAVKSARLHEFFSPAEKLPPTLEYRCEWRIRLGRLKQDSEDHWWGIREGTDISELANEVILDLENVGLPYLREHASDESLLRAWAQEPSAVKRFLGDIVLLRHLGSVEEFETALLRVEGHAASVEYRELIARLRLTMAR